LLTLIVLPALYVRFSGVVVRKAEKVPFLKSIPGDAK
jgi:hypothetical protein